MKYDNLFSNKGTSANVQPTPVATMVEELKAVVNRGNGQFRLDSPQPRFLRLKRRTVSRVAQVLRHPGI